MTHFHSFTADANTICMWYLLKPTIYHAVLILGLENQQAPALGQRETKRTLENENLAVLLNSFKTLKICQEPLSCKLFVVLSS